MITAQWYGGPKDGELVSLPSPQHPVRWTEYPSHRFELLPTWAGNSWRLLWAERKRID